jgi:hypothetical protein
LRSVFWLASRSEAALIIAFETLEIREICEKSDAADKALGVNAAQALRRRLADMRAADSPVELVVGNPAHETFDGLECTTLKLPDGYLLRFVANHVKNPIDSKNAVDWAKVGRIRIVGIIK